jgi:low affinity Fe/Cu permease
MNNFFRRFANKAADSLGTGWAFMAAILTIAVWGITGPIFHFSDTWQLIINTATNLITFLMVFMIQNTQNRDAKAIPLKLDELIRAMHGARNNLASIEQLSDEELEALRLQFARMSQYYASLEPAEQVVVAAIVDEGEGGPHPVDSKDNNPQPDTPPQRETFPSTSVPSSENEKKPIRNLPL